MFSQTSFLCSIPQAFASPSQYALWQRQAELDFLFEQDDVESARPPAAHQVRASAASVAAVGRALCGGAAQAPLPATGDSLRARTPGRRSRRAADRTCAAGFGARPGLRRRAPDSIENMESKRC